MQFCILQSESNWYSIENRNMLKKTHTKTHTHKHSQTYTHAHKSESFGVVKHKSTKQRHNVRKLSGIHTVAMCKCNRYYSYSQENGNHHNTQNKKKKTTNKKTVISKKNAYILVLANEQTRCLLC